MAIAIVIEKKPTIEYEVETTTLHSYLMTVGEMRLDASFYTEKSQKAIRLLQKSGYKITSIKDYAVRVFNPPPIKRQYSGKEGTPYLTPTEMFQFRLRPTKFVFANKMEDIQDWFVKDGWVILTQSGNVGIPLYVTKALGRFVVSQNVIRIVPKKNMLSGFLYAYLSTWMGQALVTKDQFGVTVEHVRPHHVDNLPFIHLPKEVQAQIHMNIVKVSTLRDKARENLVRAEQLLLKELDLPKITRIPKITQSFSKKMLNFNQRLDATYYDIEVRKLQNKILESDNSRLGDVADVFLPTRFKRIYVEKEYGVSFLQGSDISLIKPRLLKYISRKVTKSLESWIIKEGWVLITRSGTVGRTSLVPSRWDGWAASEHLLRIIPFENSIGSGYLEAFLACPFGYRQVISKVYGGVVDELSEDGLKDVVVPILLSKVRDEIDRLVIEAYELRELANRIEDETVRTLENMLSTHKKLEVNEEYLKEINAYAETVELIGDEEFRESLEQAKKGKAVPFEVSPKEQ